MSQEGISFNDMETRYRHKQVLTLAPLMVLRMIGARTTISLTFVGGRGNRSSATLLLNGMQPAPSLGWANGKDRVAEGEGRKI